jgi:hypothetical protein
MPSSRSISSNTPPNCSDEKRLWLSSVVPAGALPKPKADQGKLEAKPPPVACGISSSGSLSGVAVLPVKLE